ncbi:MAG: DNA gyrase subunit A [Anaerolineae bacterium]|nr:DNA gyrase subunit A [Anaerolineae bacterium]
MTQRTVDLATDLEQAYYEYAVEVITDRALPRVEDGLLPVQRRILYAMHDMGLHAGKPYKKSARVVGEVLGKYHPHGDSSVYGAMVRLAQDFSLRMPLVDGQGNFGSIDGDAPAAMRYTEARLAPIAAELVQDIEREIVDWVDNFDSSLREPVILPTVLPNLLVNGAGGVAVGMATKLPPHNLGEVCQALIYVAERWAGRDKITVDQLLRYIPGPDFPTGGVTYRYRVDPAANGTGEAVEDTIRAAYETGQGRIVTQARLAIEKTKGGKADIVVTELPYLVQKSTVLERIAREVRDGRITGVTDLRDESDYTGMRVVIEVSRLADPRQVLESLLAYTQLRQTFGVISLVLVEEAGWVEPRLLSLREMLIHFIAHRLRCIERRSRHELAQREARLHLVEGLLKALGVIDRVIAEIKKSKTSDTARQNLMKKFKFSEVQARAILEMQLRRLAALERARLEEERQELAARIEVLRALLVAENRRLAVFIEETKTLEAQYATPRRTVILDDETQAAGIATTTEAELAMPEGPQIIAITNRGVQRAEADSFSYKVKAGPTAKPVEAHLLHLPARPEDTTLLVSNQGRAWRAPLGRLPAEATFADLGLEKGEVLTGGGVLASGCYLVLGTRAGNVKRIKIEDLGMAEASWAAIIGLAGRDDEVLFAAVVSDEAEVMFFTKGGKAIRFAASQVNPQATPSARGVMGLKLRKDDRLVAGTAFEPGEDVQVVIVSQAGFVKRVPLAEFPVQGRGGQGVQSLETTKATGPVAAAAIAAGGAQACDVLSAKGLRHRLPLADLPVADRRKRGEKLVDFGEDDVMMGVVTL